MIIEPKGSGRLGDLSGTDRHPLRSLAWLKNHIDLLILQPDQKVAILQWDLGPYKTTLLNQKVSGLVVGLSPTAELSQSLNWVVVNDLHEAGKFDI